jgi:hypothetical protein
MESSAMADKKQQPRTTIEAPRSSDYEMMGQAYGLKPAPENNLPDVYRPAVPGSAVDQAMAQIITAQRVPIKRDVGRIMSTIKALAQAAGPAYVYRIPFKEKKGTAQERTVFVEGPTIKLAMDLARTYGNCDTKVDVRDDGNVWTFKARFIDAETGFNTERLFQQRKRQNTGMRDNERQLDIVFQIGQSKAIRNVVVNSLGTFVDFMVQEAKAGLLQRIENNVTGARKWILEQFEIMEFPIVRVTRIYGMQIEKMPPQMLAKLYAEITAIHEGVTSLDDLYPDSEAEAEAMAEAQARDNGESTDDTAAGSGRPRGNQKAQPDVRGGGRGGAGDRPKPSAGKPAVEPRPAPEQPAARDDVDQHGPVDDAGAAPAHDRAGLGDRGEPAEDQGRPHDRGEEAVADPASEEPESAPAGAEGDGGGAADEDAGEGSGGDEGGGDDDEDEGGAPADGDFNWSGE